MMLLGAASPRRERCEALASRCPRSNIRSVLRLRSAQRMNRLWWMVFGPAYLRGYKAGLLDGEMACLEREIERCEREALQTVAAIEHQRLRLAGKESPHRTVH